MTSPCPLPPALEALGELAYNLCWDWMPEIESLFEDIDPDLWEHTGENPVALLRHVDQRRLDALASDDGFVARVELARELVEGYLREPRWFQRAHQERDLVVAYFSAEFGLTGCLPIYSGGLGILAGDHLKSASDLGVPLVGVGLLYRKGYFRQYLDAEGRQKERYPENDFASMPLRLARRADGSAVEISVEFPGRDVYARVWRIDVGRVPLYLLDTDVPQNGARDRRITRVLYSGGSERRIQQLMMLGIGGLRALIALGIEPTVCHLNEGHAAFLAVERIRQLMSRRSIDYALAREILDDGNLFTTHTPVPAGFDLFDRELVERYLERYLGTLGLGVDEFMKLGRHDSEEEGEPLNMAVLAIRHALHRNGVSELHGQVSRRLLQDRGAWADWPIDEVPIDHVTNGVHTQTWIAPEMGRLFDRYLGHGWRAEIALERTWESIDRIPDDELWQTHLELRRQLAAYVRTRLVRQRFNGEELEDGDALTIGFARRFATYKRATLLFSDPKRLARIVSNRSHPVRFIFSGKAHPADLPGKEFIQQIALQLREEPFARSIFFLENYDIPLAKRLVRGVDVWLNNPQRPKEASGTSGIKVVANGGLNCSILDGWWAEGHHDARGWAIGGGEDWMPERDAIEATELYDLLEHEIAPLYFERDDRGVPVDWVLMMKASMKALIARFSSDRMLVEYVDRFYLPSAHRVRVRLDDPVSSNAVISWKEKVRRCWADVRVLDVGSSADAIEAKLHLGRLSPDDVDVQLYPGATIARRSAAAISMTHGGALDGVHSYSASLEIQGGHRYQVRVIPRHRDVLIPQEMEMIRWADR